MGEDRRVWEEGDLGAGDGRVVEVADDVQWRGGLAALEGDAIDFAIAVDFGFEPVGECVDTLRADTVQTARVFVGALAELTTGVQVGEHQLDGGHAPLRVHLDRDTAAVVFDRAGAIEVDPDLDRVADAGEVLVDGVVQNL